MIAARLLICLLMLGPGRTGAAVQSPGDAAPGMPASAAAALRPALLGAAAEARVELLHVRDADLRDVLRSLAHQHGLNLRVDAAIDARVTLRLADLRVLDVLVFLADEFDLELHQRGALLRVAPRRTAPPAPRVSVSEGLLSADLRGADLAAVMRAIALESGLNIVVRRGTQGVVTGMLQGVPVAQGLRTLLHANGFAVHERDGILHVDRGGGSAAEGASSPGTWVQVADSLVTMDVRGARVADVLREVAQQAGLNLVTYALPEARITARVAGLTLAETLTFLFRGTTATYRYEQGIYYVGDKSTAGIASTRLFRLDHLRADAALELVPTPIREEASLRVVKEHNALMATGTHDILFELERFIAEVDYPTPQILIEALVVEVSADDVFRLGIALEHDQDDVNDRGDAAHRPSRNLVSFGDDGLDVRGDGTDADGVLDAIGDVAGLFGVHTIGRLPDDFYFRIQALSREGYVDVRSRPQISTLNGHPASISIGETQYFILNSATPYAAPGDVVVRETQRFEQIEARVSLEVVPWVSASGEVTAEIRPEFSTPQGGFDPEVPPTISTRVLDATVRLQDGETIILGGLIQEVERRTLNKVPFLGSIPLLGRLFRNVDRATANSELVIFLTPHVFYGDARDDERWRGLRDELGVERPRSLRIGHTHAEWEAPR